MSKTNHKVNIECKFRVVELNESSQIRKGYCSLTRDILLILWSDRFLVHIFLGVTILTEINADITIALHCSKQQNMIRNDWNSVKPDKEIKSRHRLIRIFTCGQKIAEKYLGLHVILDNVEDLPLNTDCNNKSNEVSQEMSEMG